MELWFRSWHGAPTDSKWIVIAQRTDTIPAIVSAIAWALLDYASQNPDRGSIVGFNVPVYAALAGLDESLIYKILQAMRVLQVISGDSRLVNWNKRQPKREDDSTERVRAYRDRRETSGMTRGSSYDADAIFERDGLQCGYCGSDKNLCVDHVLPILLGGTDDDRNLLTACKKCNTGKGGRTLEQADMHLRKPEAQERFTKYLIDQAALWSVQSESVDNSVTGSAPTVDEVTEDLSLTVTLEKKREEETRTEEKEKEKESAGTPARTLSPQQRIVGVIAGLCQMNLKIKSHAARCGKTAAELLQAGYTCENLANFARWWTSDKWRRENTPVPTLAQLTDKIAQGAGYQSCVGNGNDSQGPPSDRFPEPAMAVRERAYRKAHPEKYPGWNEV